MMHDTMRHKNTTPEQAAKTTCRTCGSTTWKLAIEGTTRELATQQLTLHTELKAKINKQATFRIWRKNPTWEATRRGIVELTNPRREGIIILSQHQCTKDFTLDHPEYFPQHKYVFTEEPQF